MIESRSYEMVSTIDTDSNDNACDKNYYVKIVNKKVTKIGATIKKSGFSYWFFSSEDPVDLSVCRNIPNKYNDKEMYKITTKNIMSAIKKYYPKFYEAVRKKVNTLV